MIEKKKMLLADIGLLITAFVWGSGFIVQKDALASYGPYWQMALRFSLASLIMGVVFFKKFRHISKEDLKAGLIIGIFLFLAYALQTVGLQYSSVGTAAFLTASYVVIVPFLFYLIKKEKTDKYNMVAAILCAIGIGLISFEDGLTIKKGDALILICAVLFAMHIVLVTILTRKHDPVVLTILQLAVAAVFSLVIAISFETPPFPIAAKNWFGLAYLAFFSTFICFLLQNVCQKYTSSTHAAILLCLESVFGTVLSILIFNESFGIQSTIGFVIVFLAVITAETKWKFLRKSNELIQ